MPRDIDHIIEEVRRRFPEVIVDQLPKLLPTDDDGIWYFRIPNDVKDISLESSYGTCPFMVEHSDSSAPSECAVWARTIQDAIAIVVADLDDRRVELSRTS